MPLRVLTNAHLGQELYDFTLQTHTFGLSLLDTEDSKLLRRDKQTLETSCVTGNKKFSWIKPEAGHGITQKNKIK